MPKISTLWGTFQTGPLGTPADGGRDRKSCGIFQTKDTFPSCLLSEDLAPQMSEHGLLLEVPQTMTHGITAIQIPLKACWDWIGGEGGLSMVILKSWTVSLTPCTKYVSLRGWRKFQINSLSQYLMAMIQEAHHSMEHNHCSSLPPNMPLQILICRRFSLISQR